MSNYFQTLNRLERERGSARAAEELEREEPMDDREPAPAATSSPAEELAGRSVAEGLRRAPGATRRKVVRAAAQPLRKRAAKPALQQAALERAEAARAASSEEAPATVADAPPATIALPQPPRARRRIAKQSLLDANTAGGDGHAPFRKLFDNLRARSGAEAVSTVVLAGAGVNDTAAHVTTGLATLARRRSLNVLVADVEEGISHPILVPRNRSLREQGPLAARAADPTASAPFASTIALNLRGGPIPAQLEEWLTSASTHHDLVILEAPPLGDSVDAALLARACDGLVIVVDPAGTTKDMLRKSVERAQAIGCRILGLVMTGTRADMPAWMGRMTGARADA